MSTLTGDIGGALTRGNATSGGRTTTVTRSMMAMLPSTRGPRLAHLAMELSMDRVRKMGTKYVVVVVMGLAFLLLEGDKERDVISEFVQHA